jgi:translation elongation factor aEF-1 beta
MGIAGIKIKIMPTSPDADLEKIKQEAKLIVESQGGKNREYNEEPVAFGLKSIIAFFEWDEEKESDEVAKEFEKIENVSSAQVIDVRRLVQ